MAGGGKWWTAEGPRMDNQRNKLYLLLVSFMAFGPVNSLKPIVKFQNCLGLRKNQKCIIFRRNIYSKVTFKAVLGKTTLSTLFLPFSSLSAVLSSQSWGAKNNGF